MKKLLIALAAVVAVGAVQAASVSWKTTAVKIMNGAGDGVVSAGTATDYTATVVFWDANDNLLDLGTSAAGAVDSTASMSQYFGTVADVFENNKSYYAQLTLASDKWTITSEKAQFSIGDQDATINFTNGSGFSDATAKISYTAGAGGWAAVPEPTSGLLMLLGVAGLALRRKRA